MYFSTICHFFYRKTCVTLESFYICNELLLTIKKNIMNKTQLIDAMASKSGLTKADSRKALDAFLESTTDALKKKDRVALIGFGTFQINKRNARIGRNPQTGKEIKIAAKNVVKFKPGSDLSSTVK